MVNYSTAALDFTFAALSDRTRRAILARLSQGESTVKSLAEPFDMSLPAVSKHLRVLESAGLLRRQIDGRIHRCRLNPEPMKTAAAWLDHYRAFWETQFDALGKFLESSSSSNLRIDKEKIKWPRHDRVKARQIKTGQRKAAPPSLSKSAAPLPRRAKKSLPPGHSANS
jgi:DNA-binding transcriptional ArsR family regulator